MPLTDKVTTQLRQLLSGKDIEPSALNNMLRLLSKWRSVLIQNTLLQKEGTQVLGGPLKGMDFLTHSAEGCHIAKLLGSYEQPLHRAISKAIKKQYSVIANIGCAEGYYAVGMARLMPDTQVLAYDLDPVAQKVCAELAEKNGVADRVSIGSVFEPSHFGSFSGENALVLCDIEGAEKELLDPVQAPALRGLDVIVESHECLVPGITETLVSWFRDSHDIELIEDDGQRQLEDAPDWFRRLAHLDQLLATWEWRSGPTPWLVMKTRKS